jgi:hypothetical protein
MLKVFLTLLLVSTLLLSCGTEEGSDGVVNNTTSQAGDAEESVETIDPRFAVSDDLPEMGFDGYEFGILYPIWSNYELGLYFAEEETGDKLNDVIYARERDVEERFNVVINPISCATIDQIFPQVSKAVMAGDEIYDMALTHCISGLAELSTGNYLLDFNSIDTFNLEKPWWNQKMNETLSVGGALLFAVSDFIIPEPNVIYFNKDIHSNYNMEDMYETVRSGKWTIDKMIEMAKIPTEDLDGNGVFDENDQYGVIAELDWMLISFMHASEQYVVEQLPDNPYPTLAMNNEKMNTIVNKVYDLLFSGNQSFTFGYQGSNPWPLDLDSGRGLFVLKGLSSAQKLRNVDVDFGIIPFPKYDEFQKEYINNSWNGFMCIPNVVADTERTAIIIEALSAESHRYFVPAYYDILLTSKLARDDESQEMLDIIYNSCVYDSGLNFSAFNAILYSIPQLMQKKSTDFGSFYATNSSAMEKQLEKVYGAILENYS